MKGALASTIGALKAIQEQKIKLPGKLTWVLLSDGEHGDFYGAQSLVNNGILKELNGDMVLYTESTSNNIIRSFKGRIFFEIKVAREISTRKCSRERGLMLSKKWLKLLMHLKPTVSLLHPIHF